MPWTMKEMTKLKVDHALAERFAKMEAAPGDRTIRDWRVKEIDNAISNGTFRTCEWATAYCKENGKTYRINGKHTSNAMCAMNGTLPKNLYIIHEHYICDTLEDVAKLYATFDTRKSIRSSGDINRSFAATVEGLADVPQTIINLAVTGMGLATFGLTVSTKVNADVRASLLHKHPEFVAWMCNVLGGSRCRTNQHVFRGPVACAMFQTWNRSHKASSEFWSLVITGQGPDHASADRKLRDFLMVAKVGQGGADNKMFLAKCIHAWNAWRTSSPTSLKYHSSANIPTAK